MVASVVAIAGAGIGAYGQYQAGQEQKKMMQQQASVSEMEAAQIRASGKREADIIGQNQVLNEMRQRKQLDKDVGSMVGAYSTRGVSVSTGSPLDVIADSISNAELDIAIGAWNSKVTADTALYNTRVAAQSKMSQASLQRQYGTSMAKNAMWQSAGTLLSGVGTAAGRFGNEKGVLATTAPSKGATTIGGSPSYYGGFVPSGKWAT